MKINILGYGIMGKQIAALLHLGGFNIDIWNNIPMDKGDLTKQVKLLGKSLKKAGSGQLNYVYDLKELSNAVTIEAVIEDLAVKKSLFQELAPRLTSPYFTNTSSYTPSEIGPGVHGLHFFNPITIRLVELFVQTPDILPQIQPIIDYLSKNGFSVVEVPAHRGYIGNYLLFREIASFLKLVEQSGSPLENILKVYTTLHEQRNIISIIDLIGIDVAYKILVNLKKEDDSIYLPQCLKIALDKNILGRKNRTSLRQVLP